MRAIEAANPDRLDGIFGDAPWTNKERLPDPTLKNLLEHFSATPSRWPMCPRTSWATAYEFLIKKFADDSGHTAQEFYTNRTVVHLMVQMLDPQPGESIYDPTCGTGGMLISALDQVKRSGGEHRTLRLYGQERNHMTAAIARMNLVLHGVEDFAIVRGDTLERPAFTDRDRLRTFDVVLANPPYSIKQWNREPGRATRGGATSWARRRRAGPTTPSSSTSWPAWTRRPAAAPSSSRTACSSARRRRRCGASWSRPTWWSACWGWDRTCSTTRRWRRAWWCAAAASRQSGRGASCSSTPSTRWPGSGP